MGRSSLRERHIALLHLRFVEVSPTGGGDVFAAVFFCVLSQGAIRSRQRIERHVWLRVRFYVLVWIGVMRTILRHVAGAIWPEFGAGVGGKAAMTHIYAFANQKGASEDEYCGQPGCFHADGDVVFWWWLSILRGMPQPFWSESTQHFCLCV